MQRFITYVTLLLLLFTSNVRLYAQDNDSIPSEDFVIASVLIASPGEEIYSTLGHACIRLQCPTHNLDYVFSSESEDATKKVILFFAGRLKMRTAAIPTTEYLSQYSKEGRGVIEYILNLPIKTKQRLWQQMDERLEEPNEPYDFLNRGCAQSVLQWLEDAIGTDSLQYGTWGEKWNRSRKEIACDNVESPWGRSFLYCFFDGKARTETLSNMRKVIVPAELIEVLQHAKAYGKPLLSKEGTTIVKQTKTIEYSWFTPLILAILILIVAIINLRLHLPVVRYGIITMAMLLGALIHYLVILSDLCCTEFNWLLVPLSPLPLLLWRWKKKALPVFIAANIIWCIGMIPLIKIAVDWEMIAFTLALTTTYIETFNKNKKLN
ncbi:MAG: DUF4105 domain-containing protein [Prevotella sp.]|nr:DUF4105 domain-containing protein [Candidatus Prevotella equi]